MYCNNDYHNRKEIAHIGANLFLYELFPSKQLQKIVNYYLL